MSKNGNHWCSIHPYKAFYTFNHLLLSCFILTENMLCLAESYNFWVIRVRHFKGRLCKALKIASITKWPAITRIPNAYVPKCHRNIG